MYASGRVSGQSEIGNGSTANQPGPPSRPVAETSDSAGGERRPHRQSCRVELLLQLALREFVAGVEACASESKEERVRLCRSESSLRTPACISGDLANECDLFKYGLVSVGWPKRS